MKIYRLSPKDYQAVMVYTVIVFLAVLLIACLLFYQVSHREESPFYAVNLEGEQKALLAYREPIMLPEHLLRWANKAAVASYTFDFVNYKKQSEFARNFFTPEGWESYQASVSGIINDVISRQLFVNSVVSGQPVIAFQGYYAGQYVWRIQLPFLVSYQSAEQVEQQRFMVTINIVKVPTNINPDGIGVNQFIMKEM